VYRAGFAFDRVNKGMNHPFPELWKRVL
jgi:hypothetical protein